MVCRVRTNLNQLINLLTTREQQQCTNKWQTKQRSNFTLTKYLLLDRSQAWSRGTFHNYYWVNYKLVPESFLDSLKTSIMRSQVVYYSIRGEIRRRSMMYQWNAKTTHILLEIWRVSFTGIYSEYLEPSCVATHFRIGAKPGTGRKKHSV